MKPEAISHISKYIKVDRNEVSLVVGNEYFPCGITIRDNHPWFYVFEDAEDDYPIPIPHFYFDIIDCKIENSWTLATEVFASGEAFTEFVPFEWARDDAFYEKLLDEDEKCMEVMKAIKLQTQRV